VEKLKRELPFSMPQHFSESGPAAKGARNRLDDACAVRARNVKNAFEAFSGSIA